VSEPHFPPPEKKVERGPYRAPSPVLPARPPVVVAKPSSRSREAVVAPAHEETPAPKESFVTSFLWRFGVRVLALAMVLALLKLLVVASDDGAKWPNAVLMVLGVAGILSAPFVLFFRLRRLVRFLFARDDDA
jgi:hypothetical protein